MKRSPILNCGPASLPEVTAATVIACADSGAEPMKILTDDGEFYWCKFVNNPHGIESVVFELMVSVLGKAIGAPIPDAATVTVPPPIAVSKRFKNGRTVAERGFGSLHVADVTESDQVQNVLNDGNPDRLPRLFALAELCMANDFQVMYQDSDDQKAFGFDFGFWVGNFGTTWDLSYVQSETSTSYTEDDWNGVQLKSDALLEVRNVVAALSESDFLAVASAVPEDWDFSPQLSQDIAESLWKRKSLTLDSIDQKLKEVS